MKDVFDTGFFELEATNFIQVILGYILMLFVVVEDSHLNIIGADGPDIKVLNVPKLVDEYRRFADLNFLILV